MAKERKHTLGWGSLAVPRPNKVVLIGHDEACETLRDVALNLRSRGLIASMYRNDDVLHAISEVMSSTAFLLIGLSRAGREVSEINSRTHTNERTILELVARMPKPIPCGVVADIDGYISAPYLTKHGELVRLVATDDPKVDSLGIFKNHKKVPRNPTDIAAATCEILRATA
ncbi:MAG TPA: hypothetical protein VMH91_00305 [Candidatus Paceibacterota bacterium]|nr:hypothetical protein [Candidatus Paceibacterota bacterium]